MADSKLGNICQENNILKCYICTEKIKNPRILSCLHSFCYNCLEQSASNGYQNCPRCDFRTSSFPGGVAALRTPFCIKNYTRYFELLLGEKTQLLCSSCGNGTEGTIICVDCNEAYCDKCDAKHNVSASSRHHKSISSTQLEGSDVVTLAQNTQCFCDIHVDEQCIFFCSDASCERLLCSACVVEHRNHNFHLLKTAGGKTRETISELAIELNNAMDYLRDILKQQNYSSDTLKDAYRSAKQDIDRLSKRLHAAVDKDIEKCFQKLNDAHEKHLQKLKDDLKKIEEDRKVIEEKLAQFACIQRFSPDHEIVALDKYIKENANYVLDRAYSHHPVNQSVTIVGDERSYINIKIDIRITNTPIDMVNIFDDPISSLLITEKLLIASHWRQGGTQCGLAVRSNSLRKFNIRLEEVKHNIYHSCPEAYRLACIEIDDKVNLLISSSHQGSPSSITWIPLDGEEHSTRKLPLPDHDKPYAVCSYGNSGAIYTTASTPRSIKKMVDVKNQGSITTLFQNTSDQNILSSPWHVCQNVTGDIIVSDFVKRSLIIFDLEGDVLCVYNDFTPGDGATPCGIATCPSGYIYVCDWNGHCIHRLDKLGNFVDYFLTEYDGLRHPTVLQYFNGKLIVGQADGVVKYFTMNK